MLKRLASIAAMLLLGALHLEAQSEPALREYFEGKTVAVKQPMPGTEEGVDIYPGTNRPTSGRPQLPRPGGREISKRNSSG